MRVDPLEKASCEASDNKPLLRRVITGSIPTSPTKGTSPTRRRRADTFDKMRQATPSPTRRKRQMENRVPTPVKRAKELMVEEIKEQEASEQDIAAICALGFDRELAIEALGETVSVVHKRAVG